MLRQLICIMTIAFLIGWLSHSAVAGLMPAGQNAAAITEEPFLQKAQQPESLPQGFELPEQGREKQSPADRLRVENVHVTSTQVFIDGLPGREFETAVFADTNSMDPLIDEGSQAIQIVPMTPDEIKIGDIISYNAGTYGTIIHRVIYTGRDDQGWYAITKGDNNSSPDPFKVRFSTVKRILVGVLY